MTSGSLLRGKAVELFVNGTFTMEDSKIDVSGTANYNRTVLNTFYFYANNYYGNSYAASPSGQNVSDNKDIAKDSLNVYGSFDLSYDDIN